MASCEVSSSLTRARQWSDETTSLGRKCFDANVDLPEPEVPTMATRQNSGILISTGENPHLSRRTVLFVLIPNGQMFNFVSVVSANFVAPLAKLLSGPLEAMIFVS